MNEVLVGEVVAGQDIVPMDLMARAIGNNADPVVLEKLMGLHERWQAHRAHQSYAAAMADAKAEFKPIKKDREVNFTTSRGRTYYKFADLPTIAEAIDPALAKHGLTYRWRTVTTAPAIVTVTCIVSHRDGYSEENSLSATADISGNKNSIQAIGSAVTYLQRYTLNAALGLTASDDDDGQTGGTTQQRPGNEQRAPLNTEPPAEPHDIERIGDDEQAWSLWGQKFYAAIKAAPSFGAVDEWIVANSDTLEELKHYDTAKYNALRHKVQALQGGKATKARDAETG